MQKGVAGQRIGVQMVSASDGSAFTGTVTVYVTGDAGTQAIGSVGSGVCTHEGNGYHSYAAAQAETNYDLIAFTFTGSGAVPVTVQVYTAINPVTAPPTAGAIADAVWDEPYAGHTTAGSFGKIMDLLRKANLTIDGTVSNAITPTTSTFSSNVSATTSAYAHAVLLFISGPLAGENSPILSYNNTNGVFVLEEPLTAAPSDGDEFVVIAGSHVHAIADIQSGLATSAGVTAAFTEIKGAGWSSATDTLEEIRDAVDAGGGSSTVIVTPLQAIAESRVHETTITLFLGENITVGPIVVTDANNQPVDVSAPCEFIISRKYRGDILVIPDGQSTKVAD